MSHILQVSGSTVPLTGVGTALGTGGTSVQTVQAVQTIPGVTTTEYSVQALPPQAVHAPQGYIFTQGFDMVSGTLQYWKSTKSSKFQLLGNYVVETNTPGVSYQL